MALHSAAESADEATQPSRPLAARALRLADLVRYITDSCPDAPIRIVRRGEGQVEEILCELDLDGVHYYLARSRPSIPPPVGLSPRELVIARLIAKGMPNKSIGDLLEISPWTVATHLRRIFGKLGVTTRAAMVSRLVEGGLI